MKTISLTALIFLLTSNAFAQGVGDSVFVISRYGTDLKSGTTVVEKAVPGFPYKVEKINEEWLWLSGGIKKGWIKKSDVVLPDRALKLYTQYIQEATNIRDQSIWYLKRGNVRVEMGEQDTAIKDYNEVLRLDSNFKEAYYNRGLLWHKKREYQKAIKDYTEAIRIDPKFLDAYNARAMIYATCSIAKYRNGLQAIEDASNACELTGWKQANYMGTLAAAYAENGDFTEAIMWQQKVIEMTTGATKKAYQIRLDLYKSKKPYRDEPDQSSNSLRNMMRSKSKQGK